MSTHKAVLNKKVGDNDSVANETILEQGVAWNAVRELYTTGILYGLCAGGALNPL